MPRTAVDTGVVVSAEALRNAAAGQESFVRCLNLHGNTEALGMASAGKYALIMAISGAQEWWFWRPGKVEQ